ncbi:MAG: spore coat associated protein CotJA [Tissierellia bacterium]|nr:spore coat associated protein CotJA [Tissierellia bacterium]
MNRDYYYERRGEKMLARAYVPIQIMNQVYSPSEALKKGTLFPELYRPYKAEKMDIGGGGFYG